ncbi:hypothetical protein D3C71_1994300 [compost metagenome]
MHGCCVNGVGESALLFALLLIRVIEEIEQLRVSCKHSVVKAFSYRYTMHFKYRHSGFDRLDGLCA